MQLNLYAKGKQWGRHLMSLLLALVLAGNAFATPPQEVRVSGRVTSSEDGQGIPGVNIVVKGTQTGTITDVDGRYSVSVSDNNAVLVFSSIGFESQEVAVSGRAVIDITMSPSTSTLDEVVVTALGIEREQRSLGYHVSNLKGDDIKQTTTENFLNSLAGRVPGVVINQTSGPGSSVSVVIRGATSLTTDNQPLFVVDGVPMSNSLNNVAQRGDGNQVDYGNAISDINPDDIESINVLKGPSAAALYGTRAANGVIIITTKSGSKKKALGVSFSTNTMFESATRLLDFHYKYANGQRIDSFDEGNAYWAGLPLDKGHKAVQWNSPLDENGNPIPTELKSYPNAMKDFLQTGVTSTNNIAISGGSDNSSFRISYSNMLHNGMIPGSDLFRNGLGLAADTKILDKLTVSTNLNFSRTHSNNRPSTGDRQANPLEAVYASSYVDYNQMRGIWVPGQEGIQQIRTDANDNPYFIAYAIDNGFTRDRIFGNISLTYEFTKNLSLLLRHSMDMYNETQETKIPFSFSRMAKGGYYLADNHFLERNSDFLLTYKTKVSDFDISVSGGGNIMTQVLSGSSAGVGSNRNNGLVIPGFYNLRNIPLDNLSVSNSYSKRAIYSLYALASIGYKDQVYVDLTYRNDWSSTLPVGEMSYDYPSVSLSWLANYTLNLPQEISLLKLRTGWAQAGNDTSPYALYSTLNPGTYNSLTTLNVPAGLLNPNLKAELATSIESGIDLNLFNDRVRFSGTYYTLDNVNQIFGVPLPQSSGYSNRLINAGKIRSTGWEIALGGTPVQNGKLKWDVDFNWSTNKTTVEELPDGLQFITFYEEAGGGSFAYLGGRIGDIYSRGYSYVKDPNSPYYRWPILSSTGEYIDLSGKENMRKVGNYNPDFIMGMQSALRYGRFLLSASLDWRKGGEFVSFTYRYGESDWKSQRQLDQLIPGNISDDLPEFLKSDPEKYIIPKAGNYPRVGGHTQETGGLTPTTDDSELKGLHDGGFIPGVIQIAGDDTPDDFSDDVYQEHLGGPGTVIMPITDIYPWDYGEHVTFDASFIKLRELSLGYQLPNIGPLRNAMFSIYTRNLMLWTKADIGIDPERAFWASSGKQGNTATQFRQGIERQNVLPWSISYGFKLSFNL